MKIDKIIQGLNGKSETELREYLLDIPKTDLVDIIVEMVNNIPEPKPVQQPTVITQEVYTKLVELITNNFVVKAEGRGRKSMFDSVGYIVSVRRVLHNYRYNRTLPTAQYNIQLKQLYMKECYRREQNGEDISNFHRTYIKRDVIYNEPPQSPLDDESANTGANNNE